MVSAIKVHNNQSGIIMQKNLYLGLFIIIIIIFGWLTFPISAQAVNWALDFDGANDYVLVPDSESLDITEAISIELWVKVDQSQNTMYTSLLVKEDAYDIGYYRDSGKIYFALFINLLVLKLIIKE